MSRRGPRFLRFLTLAAALLGLAPAPGGATAQALPPEGVVADISEHMVAISAGFTGTDILLFGAIEPGTDVAVVVHGPESAATIRRKERVAGVWMNRDRLDFARAPSFYAVMTNRPLAAFTDEVTRLIQEIGLDGIRLVPGREADRLRPDLGDFRRALVREKARRGLYTAAEGAISILRGRLFRTTVHIPSNAPVGSYGVRVFLFRDGRILSAQTSTFDVGKVGFTAHVHDMAYRHSLAYGVLAIVIAVVAGWAAGAIFRKH